MDPVNASGASMMAMSLGQWRSAGQGEGLAAVARDPTPENISAADEAGTQSAFTMDLLKKTLSIDLTNADDLAEMLGQGSRVDVYA